MRIRKLSTKKKKEELLNSLRGLEFSVEIEISPNQNILYKIQKDGICKWGRYG
jgi:hypothetical protein